LLVAYLIVLVIHCRTNIKLHISCTSGANSVRKLKRQL